MSEYIVCASCGPDRPCKHELAWEATERADRFDRSWWHYADDCPSAPERLPSMEARAAAEPSVGPLDVERLARAMMQQHTSRLMQTFPGHPEHWDEHADDGEKAEWLQRAESVATEYARLASLQDKQSGDRPPE